MDATGANHRIGVSRLNGHRGGKGQDGVCDKKKRTDVFSLICPC
jgi:ribosomal protein L15